LPRRIPLDRDSETRLRAQPWQPPSINLLPAMELRTGEFKTDAGERLTFGAVGRGQALLIDFGWLSHFGHAWEFAPYRSFVERLAGSRTVILHDKPGFGASAGSTGPLTVTAGAAAIEALAGHLGLARFDLMGAL
jgi:pimeloyl-ACP methyl ester carboxylesterase